MFRFLAAVMTLCLLVFGVAPPALAASSFETVRQTYSQVSAGKIDPDAAAEVLEAFLAAHPGEPVVTAFLGSVKTMIARDAFFPLTKLAAANAGFELLDEAVERLDRAPRSHDYDGQLEILLVSGLTNAAVPTFFGRRPMARRDLSQASALASFAAAPAEVRAEVYAWLAVLAADGDAARADALLAQARAEDSTTADAIWTKER